MWWSTSATRSPMPGRTPLGPARGRTHRRGSRAVRLPGRGAIRHGLAASAPTNWADGRRGCRSWSQMRVSGCAAPAPLDDPRGRPCTRWCTSDHQARAEALPVMHRGSRLPWCHPDERPSWIAVPSVPRPTEANAPTLPHESGLRPEHTIKAAIPSSSESGLLSLITCSLVFGTRLVVAAMEPRAPARECRCLRFGRHQQRVRKAAQAGPNLVTSSRSYLRGVPSVTLIHLRRSAPATRSSAGSGRPRGASVTSTAS
jgi:hypothetical protein